MSILERNVVHSGTISTRSVFYSLFLLLLVVSLFFIPEIVRFQDSMTGKNARRSTGPAQAVNLDDLIPDQSVHPTSSLDRVLMMVNSGYLEGSRGEAVEGQKGTEAVKDEGANVASPSDLSSLEDRVTLERTFQRDDITWAKLGGSSVKRSFKSSQDAASNILRQLGERQSNVRFALINYINGLGWIMRGDQKLMSAEEAVAYIEQLDINVTQAMLTGDVDTVDYENWKKVSLGPLIGSGKAAAFKSGKGISFNPRLTLMDVQVTKGSDYVRKGKKWVLRQAPSSINFGGFVMGKDVRKITIYHNGRRVGDVSLGRANNADGIRPFKWRYNSAMGVFTFRAISLGGELFEKNYVFLRRMVGKFPQDAQGNFRLPFGNGDYNELALRNLDTRLDRYFRVGGRVKVNAPAGYEPF